MQVWSPSTMKVQPLLFFPHPSLKFTAGLLFNRLIPQDGLAWSSSPSVCIGHCVHFLRGLQLFTMSRQEGGKRDRLPGWGRFSQQEGQLLGNLGKKREERRQGIDLILKIRGHHRQTPMNSMNSRALCQKKSSKIFLLL